MNSTDGDAAEFREAVERAARWMGEYFDNPGRFPVLSPLAPGEVRSAFPAKPPRQGRPLQDLLDEFESYIVPGVTHWNHPSFFAYFSITGSYPGILGEFLTAALNVNGMLWRTCPALTELETLCLDYLLDLVGVDRKFFGQILDTASTSTLVALTAARETVEGLDVRAKGLAGRADIPPLVLYCSEETHSSIEKAAIVLGIGTDHVRKIRCDAAFKMDPSALELAIEQDVKAGMRPFCVVATIGTTSTTSVDPVPQIAEICDRHGLWLHVDAAYAWAAAILPEKKHILDGCDRADSIVVNPHKWLFTPIDLSVLFCRDQNLLKRAFSLVPEYLRSDGEEEQPNLMDYGFQLGRRFRALKLWMVINYFGVEGLAKRIREHIRLAQLFKEWVERHPDFEVMAPAEFSLVCFRFIAPGCDDQQCDRLNETLLDAINKSGKAFLSHTKIRGRFVLRCAIGNIRTQDHHIEALEALLAREAAGLNRR